MHTLIKAAQGRRRGDGWCQTLWVNESERKRERGVGADMPLENGPWVFFLLKEKKRRV